jgi:hypothetical protein
MILAHGAAEFLRDTWDDNYYIAVCNKTGGIAIYNEERNLFISPWVDGPLKFVDSLDGKYKNIEQITKFGRSFSVIRVPYAFKLFVQEMQALNVKMSIITDDNVSQFDNMKFSKVKLDLPKPIEDEKETTEYLFSDDDFDSILDSDSESDFDDHPRLKIHGGAVAKIDYETLLPMDTTTNNISSLISQSESAKPPEIINNVFNVGDPVHFNGDFLKTRVWTIQEFDKGFAILKTENDQGLEPGMNMKVAHLADIVPAVPEQPQVAQPIDSFSPNAGFNPVFNIVTGNENTIESSPTKLAAENNKNTVDNTKPTEDDAATSTAADIFSRPLIKMAGEAKKDVLPINGGAIVIKKLS